MESNIVLFKCQINKLFLHFSKYVYHSIIFVKALFNISETCLKSVCVNRTKMRLEFEEF